MPASVQVYRGRLKSGEEVAVKVQRPFILETVTVDLFVLRGIFVFLRRFKGLHTDFVALLDEWATRFFEELDYVHEVNSPLQQLEYETCMPPFPLSNVGWESAIQRLATAQTRCCRSQSSRRPCWRSPAGQHPGAEHD